MNNLKEVKQKANWCLGCKNRPCSNACPMHTSIPEFIEKIKEDKIEEAYQILIQNNLFSHVCGLICPQENQCEGSCVRGIKGNPTEIGKLEVFVNEWAVENQIEPKIFQKEGVSGRKVAIIGAGPAGLSCAFELAKEGVRSVVFEKEEVLGGILNYGIPDFRLEKKIIDKMIQVLKKMGVEFRLGHALGKNISIVELKEEYDFVFIGIGAELSSMYKLADQKLDSVYDSDTFLRAYNDKNFISNLGKVVVIGGGNVAMDSARVAIRMGAEEVSILYRRDEAHMPARKVELADCKKDGVKWIELTRVDRANIENGKMLSVHCNKTEIIDGKAQDVEGKEFDYEADTVVFAIGLKPNKELLEKEGLEITDWGTIQVDENYKTSIENVYAGGDVAENKSVVCKALASGKKAAEAITEKILK
ncbi:MAG: NAD(P)-dependent oxidoreductase [Clostridia bacterium]|nr:NAD(P)-dependent oxidoreductase [Clostridia bacterium]